MKVLDTTFLIDFIAGTKKSKSKMESIMHEPVIVSEVSAIELLAGAYNSKFRDEQIKTITNTLDQLNIVAISEYLRVNIAVGFVENMLLDSVKAF
jgi:predicted nucleic acid-binding protein